MKRNKYLLIFYLSILLTGVLAFFFSKINETIGYLVCAVLPMLLAFWIVFKKRFTKRIFACIGLIILFQVAELIGLHAISIKPKVIAYTDNVDQASKIQKVLAEEYYSPTVSRDGSHYEIYLKTSDKEFTKALITVAQSDAINKEVKLNLEVEQYLLRSVEYEEHLHSALDKTIKSIDGVQDVNIELFIPEIITFLDPYEPKISINVVIDPGQNSQLIEKTIRNLTIHSVNSLEDKNLKIDVKTKN